MFSTATITEAGDGETALTLSRTTEFDAVFLDYNMPGMNGLAAIKRLAADSAVAAGS